MLGLQWLRSLGLPVPTHPDLEAIIAAALLVIFSYAAGMVIGRWLGERMETLLLKNAPTLLDGFTGRICALVRYAMAALTLAAISGFGTFGSIGLLIVAVGLGLAVGLLVYQFVRGLGLGYGGSLLLAFVMLMSVTAGWLGGLVPLIEGLRRAGFTLGTRHITLLSLLNAAIVGVLLFLAVRLANRMLIRWIGGLNALDLSQRVLTQKLAGIAVVTIAVFVGIDLLGIDLTALAVFSGAFGLAVGFGLQKTFGNLIAGLILLLDRSIKPGDVIVVGDTFGWVNKIGVRYVSVLTRDGKEHLIPNEKLMTEPVENWSYSNRNVRLHIPITTAYECDIHQAQKLMLQATEGIARVLRDPAPVCWLMGFTERGAEHELRVWITDPEQGVGNVKGEILNRVWDLFKENGISLGYPQREVWLRPQS